MWSSSVFGPTHHVDVPSASVPVTRSICVPSAATSTAGRDAARDVDAALDTELLALELHRRSSRAAASAPTGTRGGGGPACRTTGPTSTRRRSGATARCRAPAVRRSRDCTVSACCASIIGCRGIRRHDRRSELDARHLTTGDREHGQRVVAEDLRRPERVHPVVGCTPHLVDDLVDRPVVDLGSHDPDAHRRNLVLRSAATGVSSVRHERRRRPRPRTRCYASSTRSSQSLLK